MVLYCIPNVVILSHVSRDKTEVFSLAFPAPNPYFGAMILQGTAVNTVAIIVGGVIGLTTDFRAVFAEVVGKHLSAQRLEAIFPGFDGQRAFIERVLCGLRGGR